MTCSSPRPSALTGKLFLLFAGLFVARQLLLVRKVGLRLRACARYVTDQPPSALHHSRCHLNSFPGALKERKEEKRHEGVERDNLERMRRAREEAQRRQMELGVCGGGGRKGKHNLMRGTAWRSHRHRGF